MAIHSPPAGAGDPPSPDHVWSHSMDRWVLPVGSNANGPDQAKKEVQPGDFSRAIGLDDMDAKQEQRRDDALHERAEKGRIEGPPGPTAQRQAVETVAMIGIEPELMEEVRDALRQLPYKQVARLIRQLTQAPVINVTRLPGS